MPTQNTTHKLFPREHLDFYKYQHGTWATAVAFRSCLTLPLIALTLVAGYKHKPLETIAGACASTIGIKSIQKANFYRRRAAYRMRQQQKSMEIRKKKEIKMTDKNMHKFINYMIGIGAALAVFSAGLATTYKYTSPKKSWLFTGLALSNTACLGGWVWAKGKVKGK